MLRQYLLATTDADADAEAPFPAPGDAHSSDLCRLVSGALLNAVHATAMLARPATGSDLAGDGLSLDASAAQLAAQCRRWILHLQATEAKGAAHSAGYLDKLYRLLWSAAAQAEKADVPQSLDLRYEALATKWLGAQARSPVPSQVFALAAGAGSRVQRLLGKERKGGDRERNDAAQLCAFYDRVRELEQACPEVGVVGGGDSGASDGIGLAPVPQERMDLLIALSAARAKCGDAGEALADGARIAGRELAKIAGHNGKESEGLRLRRAVAMLYKSLFGWHTVALEVTKQLGLAGAAAGASKTPTKALKRPAVSRKTLVQLGDLLSAATAECQAAVEQVQRLTELAQCRLLSLLVKCWRAVVKLPSWYQALAAGSTGTEGDDVDVTFLDALQVLASLGTTCLEVYEVAQEHSHSGQQENEDMPPPPTPGASAAAPPATPQRSSAPAQSTPAPTPAQTPRTAARGKPQNAQSQKLEEMRQLEPHVHASVVDALAQAATIRIAAIGSALNSAGCGSDVGGVSDELGSATSDLQTAELHAREARAMRTLAHANQTLGKALADAGLLAHSIPPQLRCCAVLERWLVSAVSADRKSTAVSMVAHLEESKLHLRYALAARALWTIGHQQAAARLLRHAIARSPEVVRGEGPDPALVERFLRYQLSVSAELTGVGAGGEGRGSEAAVEVALAYPALSRDALMKQPFMQQLPLDGLTSGVCVEEAAGASQQVVLSLHPALHAPHSSACGDAYAEASRMVMPLASNACSELTVIAAELRCHTTLVSDHKLRFELCKAAGQGKVTGKAKGKRKQNEATDEVLPVLVDCTNRLLARAEAISSDSGSSARWVRLRHGLVLVEATQVNQGTTSHPSHCPSSLDPPYRTPRPSLPDHAPVGAALLGCAQVRRRGSGQWKRRELFGADRARLSRPRGGGGNRGAHWFAS